MTRGTTSRSFSLRSTDKERRMSFRTCESPHWEKGCGTSSLTSEDPLFKSQKSLNPEVFRAYHSLTFILPFNRFLGCCSGAKKRQSGEIGKVGLTPPFLATSSRSQLCLQMTSVVTIFFVNLFQFQSFISKLFVTSTPRISVIRSCGWRRVCPSTVDLLYTAYASMILYFIPVVTSEASLGIPYFYFGGLEICIIVICQVQLSLHGT